jgi:hypothetical protein
MKRTGIILLAIGAMITILSAVDFVFFTRENVVDIGDLQINTRKKHSIPWSPFAGVAIIAVGAGAYLLGTKRTLMN